MLEKSWDLQVQTNEGIEVMSSFWGIRPERG